jgi:hypothetical protein
MSRLGLSITMSLDGYVAGPNQSVENPLGEGGIALHDWAFAVRSFRAVHGLEGGSAGIRRSTCRSSCSRTTSASRSP